MPWENSTRASGRADRDYDPPTTMYHRPERKQNPLVMWLVTIACGVVAFIVGLIIVSAMV
jgi:hypothetical protein